MSATKTKKTNSKNKSKSSSSSSTTIKNNKKLSKNNKMANILNVSFEKIIDDTITPEEIQNIKSFKEKRKIIENNEFNDYDKIIKVDNKQFKIKKNKAKTTVISGFKINIDPLNKNVCDDNFSKKKINENINNFSEEIHNNFLNEEVVSPVEDYSQNLDKEFLKNNLVINSISDDTAEILDAAPNQNIFVPSYTVQINDSNETNNFTNYGNELLQQNQMALNNNPILENISSKIDALISTTQEIKDNMNDDIDDEHLLEYSEKFDINEPVPPTFINVPIPLEFQNNALTQKNVKVNFGFKRKEFYKK
ncbi:hypothetical protein [Mycoplasmoides pirum]|uniref:hypothetical protein n=1 Tax=Mycoplasmoides pirum TaxID=2122 RepID=UPI00047F7F17|nr:hypothetical protein [Mycoplasmoides pirum]